MVSYKELFGFIWRAMREQKWAFTLLLIMNSLAWPLDALLWPFILRLSVDIFTAYDSNRLAAWGALKVPIIAALSLVVFVEAVSRSMGFLIAKVIPKFQANIRMKMFDHIQHHSPHYFNERFSGSLANKMVDMTTGLEVITQQLYWPVIPALSASIMGIFFLWFINPLFSLLMVAWIILHLTFCLSFVRRIDLRENLHSEARSTLLGKIVDSFTNNFAVNLFYRFNHEKQSVLNFQREEMLTNIASRRFVEKVRMGLSSFYILSIIVVMFGALLYLWVHGKITTGEVVQVFTTMWSLTMIFWVVGMTLPTLFQSFGTLRQAYSVMKDPQDIQDKPHAKELNVKGGEIVFNNVTFHYGEKKLFENKNVQIRAGERVGLVGYTGAGKSTFVNLILRLFPLHQGKIFIDGQDVAEATLESIRCQIALIPQEPILFHRSLKDNIAYGKPEATDEEIFYASKLAHCDEFIRRIPQGYEAKVGERGTKLSGGEKQRIAIARAILVNAPILILDEATSSLDSLTERYIQDSLETLMQNRTTIVIAHRLSTLSRMDRLLIFQEGKIVEEGSHSELLQKGGLYAKMWKMQVGGFLPEKEN